MSSYIQVVVVVTDFLLAQHELQLIQNPLTLTVFERISQVQCRSERDQYPASRCVVSEVMCWYSPSRSWQVRTLYFCDVIQLTAEQLETMTSGCLGWH